MSKRVALRASPSLWRKALPTFAGVWLASVPAFGCGGETATPRMVGPSQSTGDDWDRIPETPDWRELTAKDGENRVNACGSALGVLRKEIECAGELCDPARELAREWLLRCGSVLPEREPEVAQLAATLDSRAALPLTACGDDGARLLRDGCGLEGGCFQTVQAWVTRCMSEVGTQLVLHRMRRLAHSDAAGDDLDLRSCVELRKEVVDAADCVHRIHCEEALERVEDYRRRCQIGPPSLLLGVHMLTVVAGAQREAAPLPVEEVELAPGSHPLALHGRRGAILRVCDERVDALDDYLEARAACEGGTLRVARTFELASGHELRLGVFDVVDDATLLRQLPDLRADGELAVRDRNRLEAFSEAVRAAIQRAERGEVGAAAEDLTKVLVEHADAIERPLLRDVLAGSDEELIPVFRELGRSKSARARRGGLSPAEMLGLARRAVTRPFADRRWDGVLEVGAPSDASSLTPAAWLPKAMAAYRDELTDLGRLAETVKLPDAERDAAVSEAETLIGQCAEAGEKLRAGRERAIACAFGTQGCPSDSDDDAALQIESAMRDEARLRHALDTLLSGAAYDSRPTLLERARQAGCEGVE